VHVSEIKGEHFDVKVYKEAITYVVLLRAKEIEQIMQDDKLPDQKKEQKLNHIRKAEAQYLRFLRTRERPENFQTIKIIGKGAFGEVKLVQRRNDGKIYALKSLVKSEMVSEGKVY
jgi:protein-serine/threonine kinase